MRSTTQKWSVSRLGFGCAYTFAFPETPVNLCGVWKTVQPGGSDSQFCVNEDNQPRWAEGFDDNTDFNYLSARIRQPFDFEGRTGTIQWQADARTSGSHGWWTETWITADPVPGPNLHDPDQLVTSKEALAISFDLNCGVSAAGLGTAGSGLVGVSRILVVHDHAFTHKYDPFTGPLANKRCVTTEQNAMNTFHVKLSKNRVEVWASDAGSAELKQIAEADIDLRFTRGYVNLSHVHYNAHKAEVTTFQSYQWAHVAFDGPQLRGAPRLRNRGPALEGPHELPRQGRLPHRLRRHRRRDLRRGRRAGHAGSPQVHGRRSDRRRLARASTSTRRTSPRATPSNTA